MGKSDQTTLNRFLRGNCSSYDSHYQTCLFADACKMLTGRRCGHFEECVLGPPDYKYRLPRYDYAKLFAQYAEQTRTQKQTVEVRRCECGTPLRPRERYCDKCATERRRKTRRESQRRYRALQVA